MFMNDAGEAVGYRQVRANLRAGRPTNRQGPADLEAVVTGTG